MYIMRCIALRMLAWRAQDNAIEESEKTTITPKITILVSFMSAVSISLQSIRRAYPSQSGRGSLARYDRKAAKQVRRIIVDTPALRFWGIVLMPVAIAIIWKLPDIITALSNIQ